MSDPFARMTPGMSLESGVGPFNLEWHNAVSDSVRHSMREKSAGLNQGAVQVTEDAEIWVANIEGEILPQFTAIGINKLLTFPDDFSDFRNRMCFVTAPLTRNRPFAIVQKSIHPNRVYFAKSAIAADEPQPPDPAWARLIGDADPFDAAAHYAIGEQVTDGGETYAAILPVDGQLTSNVTYWVRLGSRRGIWDGSAYAAGEVVAIPSLGEILVSGISRLLLQVSHPRDVYAGVSELGISTQTEPGPLEILWKEDGTGEKWAIVRFINDTFESQTCTGTGSLAFGSMELSAAGIRYGGDLVAGVLALAGSGTSTPPAYAGEGEPTLPALTLTGTGKVYLPTPGGSLYFGAMTLAGTGTVVNPPSGFAFMPFGSLTMAGTGTSTPPTCTGTGAMVFGVLDIDGGGSHGSGITSINGQTGPAVTLASADAWIVISQLSNTITFDFDASLLPPAPTINGGTGYTFTLSSSDSTITIGAASAGIIDFTARVATNLVSGIVSIIAQNFAGDKTFVDDVVIEGGLVVGTPAGSFGSIPIVFWSESGFNQTALFYGAVAASQADIACSYLRGHGEDGSGGYTARLKLSPDLEAEGDLGDGSIVASIYTESKEGEISLSIAAADAPPVTDGMTKVRIASSIDLSLITVSAWSLTVAYVSPGSLVSNVVSGDTLKFRCIRGHTSASISEPGIGADWETYWDEMGGFGSPPGPTLIAPVVELSENNGNIIEGFTGPLFGLQFCAGFLVDPLTLLVPYSYPKLTDGSVVVGSTDGALDSLATSRTVGGNLQLKLASDSWIGFGEANY